MVIWKEVHIYNGNCKGKSLDTLPDRSDLCNTQHTDPTAHQALQCGPKPWPSGQVFNLLPLSFLTSHIKSTADVVGKLMIMLAWCLCHFMASADWEAAIPEMLLFQSVTASATVRPENTHINTNEITVGKGIKVYILYETKCSFCLKTSQHICEVPYFLQNWSKYNEPKAMFTESGCTVWTLSSPNITPKGIMTK